MTRIKRFVLLVCMASVLFVGTAAAESIKGRYLVVRNTGPCAHDSKLPIVGDTAVLAWKVSQGTYQGARLNDLAVVALVCGDSTLGIDEKVKTRTTFLVDERATKSQQAALVAMAKTLAGNTIQEVVGVKPVKIDMTVWQGCAMGYASLKTDLVNIRTRRLFDSDESGRREMADPVLAKLYYRYPAYALEYSYSGRDFEGESVRFVQRDLRSAAVGGFWF